MHAGKRKKPFIRCLDFPWGFVHHNQPSPKGRVHITKFKCNLLLPYCNPSKTGWCRKAWAQNLNAPHQNLKFKHLYYPWQDSKNFTSGCNKEEIDSAISKFETHEVASGSCQRCKHFEQTGWEKCAKDLRQLLRGRWGWRKSWSWPNLEKYSHTLQAHRQGGVRGGSLEPPFWPSKDFTYTV